MPTDKPYTTDNAALKRRLDVGRATAIAAFKAVRLKRSVSGHWVAAKHPGIRVALLPYAIQVQTWREKEDRWRVFRRWMTGALAGIDLPHELRIALKDALEGAL